MLKRILNICKIWLKVNAMQFLVNETMKLILYICRSMNNLKLRFLKLLYFSRNILVIPTCIC